MPNWGEVLKQVNDLSAFHAAESKKAVDTVRRQYLQALHNKRGRYVIAYYSGWLNKPDAPSSDINDEDKNGFMMAVHRLKDKKKVGLDLMIHTPGGSVAATESLVHYLRQMFGKNIVAIVPQIAMSAGTMLACSCKQIIMGKHSNLGPIDPWLRGIPAAGVLKELEEIYDDIKHDAGRIAIWRPILSQYKPTFIRQCRLGIDWSRRFVRQQLREVMFDGKGTAKERQRKAAKIVNILGDAERHKTHSRHIHVEECERMGLNILRLEDDQDLQDLVLTVHHCYMHALMNTGSYKIIENHNGVGFFKQQKQMAIQKLV